MPRVKRDPERDRLMQVRRSRVERARLRVVICAIEVAELRRAREELQCTRTEDLDTHAQLSDWIEGKLRDLEFETAAYQTELSFLVPSKPPTYNPHALMMHPALYGGKTLDEFRSEQEEQWRREREQFLDEEFHSARVRAFSFVAGWQCYCADERMPLRSRYPSYAEVRDYLLPIYPEAIAMRAALYATPTFGSMLHVGIDFEAQDEFSGFRLKP